MLGLIALMRALESGVATSRSLVESALAKSPDPAGEGRRIFIALDPDCVRAQADMIDRARHLGRHPGPFAGIPGCSMYAEKSLVPAVACSRRTVERPPIVLLLRACVRMGLSRSDA